MPHAENGSNAVNGEKQSSQFLAVSFSIPPEHLMQLPP